MPVTKEVLIERVRYLRDVQRSLEGVAKEVVVIAIAGPIINLIVRTPFIFFSIVLTIVLALVGIVVALIRIQDKY